MSIRCNWMMKFAINRLEIFFYLEEVTRNLKFSNIQKLESR